MQPQTLTTASTKPNGSACAILARMRSRLVSLRMCHLRHLRHQLDTQRRARYAYGRCNRRTRTKAAPLAGVPGR